MALPVLTQLLVLRSGLAVGSRTGMVLAPPGSGASHVHPPEGKAKGRFAVSVSGNWRITFAFSEKDAIDVDYEDYH